LTFSAVLLFPKQISKKAPWHLLCLFIQNRMNPNASSCRTRAFTLVEMLTVIAIISILAALLLPVLDKSEGRAKRIVCVNSMEQVGLAFHTFSNDHNGKYPMAISTNDGGSMEYVQSGFEAGEEFYTSFRHFQMLSSELVFPQTLVCPADTRVASTNFPGLQNENLSYFVGVESTFDKPTTVLAGDRNLATNSFNQPTILGLGVGSKLVWTWQLHQFKGNVVFADGHVEQWNDSSLASAESSSPFTQSLFLPSVLPGVLPLAGDGSGSSAPAPNFGAPAGGSGASPMIPNGPSSEQWVSSPARKTGSGPDSSMPEVSTSAGQPTAPAMPENPGERLYATETVSQAQAPDQTLVAPGAGASAATDEVVSAQDPNAGMSQFDRHMTMVAQNSLVWLYILLCILVLLYLLYRRVRRKSGKRANQWEEERL
jgi:prepilin-type N-terminal cleavage/methylation domain-containing protein/prepilin-type processing-associated H-X9-DG protein